MIGETMEKTFLVPFKKQNGKKIPYIGMWYIKVIFVWVVRSTILYK